MPRPNLPFWKIADHTLAVTRIYRSLLRAARPLPDPIHRSHIRVFGRDAFERNRHVTSLTRCTEFMRLAEEDVQRVRSAASGDVASTQWLDDLAWGRTGRLRDVLNTLKEARKKGSHRLVRDVRPHTQARFASRTHSHSIALPAHLLALLRIPSPPPVPPPRRAPPTRIQDWNPRKLGRLHLVVTAHYEPFIRDKRRGTPVRLAMMLKRRAERGLRIVGRWKEAEEWQRWAEAEVVLQQHVMQHDTAGGEGKAAVKEAQEWVNAARQFVRLSEAERQRQVKRRWQTRAKMEAALKDIKERQREYRKQQSSANCSDDEGGSSSNA